MGRPRRPPTTVVRLPVSVVEAIDARRGPLARGELLERLLAAPEGVRRPVVSERARAQFRA